MFTIILGIISQALESISNSYRKKALDNTTLGKSTFSLLGPISGIFLIYSLILILGVEIKIYGDFFILTLIFILSIIEIIVNFLYIYVYKKIKISQLLPYDNLDRLLIIIFGFFLFYGTSNQTSLTTLFITILTVIIIILFSVDFKKFTVSKYIYIYLFALILQSISTLGIGYILLDYSTLDYIGYNIIIMLLLYYIITILYKEPIKNILKQNKIFYKSRGITLLFGRSSFIIGLYIIESSGVIIATLLSFLGIIFSILSMKFILKDNPTKKDIILAFIVIIMIGTGYYFK